MTTIAYFHGFGSSTNSSKVATIKAAVEADGHSFLALEYPSYDPTECFTSFDAQLGDLYLDDVICVGTSLGGFWADVMARDRGSVAVLVNPCIFPSASLRKYVTESGKFTDYAGVERALTNDLVAAYEKFERTVPEHEGRFVLLANDDDVIDYRIAFDRFTDNADISVAFDCGYGHRMDGATDMIIDTIKRAVMSIAL